MIGRAKRTVVVEGSDRGSKTGSRLSGQKWGGDLTGRIACWRVMLMDFRRLLQRHVSDGIRKILIALWVRGDI